MQCDFLFGPFASLHSLVAMTAAIIVDAKFSSPFKAFSWWQHFLFSFEKIRSLNMMSLIILSFHFTNTKFQPFSIYREKCSSSFLRLILFPWLFLITSFPEIQQMLLHNYCSIFFFYFLFPLSVGSFLLCLSLSLSLSHIQYIDIWRIFIQMFYKQRMGSEWLGS